jgi:hypothetical protein
MPPDKHQAQLLSDPETCGSVLLAIALSKYKEQAFTVDPMSLILDLEDDFRTTLPEDNENKLKAILMATETPIFQQDPEAFRSICITLWNGDPQIGFNETLTLSEAIWGMFEVKTCYGELSLGPGIQRMVEVLSDEEVTDPEEHEDPYNHIKAAVQERYGVWREQMLGLGVNPQDLPVLDAD